MPVLFCLEDLFFCLAVVELERLWFFDEMLEVFDDLLEVALVMLEVAFRLPILPIVVPFPNVELVPLPIVLFLAFV